MLTFIDPEKGTLRLWRLLTWNVIAILGITGLVVRHVIPLLPAVAIGYPALFVANVLIVRRATRLLENALQGPVRIPRGPWFAAFVYTAAGVVAVVAWIRKPDLSHAVQVLIAIVLISYIWFLIHRLRRTTKNQTKR